MRSEMGGMRWILALVVLCAGLGHAFADDDVGAARDHYRRATRAYELGLYDEAIREYTLAYKAKDDPAILYDMAQAHKLANHPVEALRLYQMYLIKVPNAAN